MKYALQIFFSTALYNFSHIVYFMTGYVIEFHLDLGAPGGSMWRRKTFQIYHLMNDNGAPRAAHVFAHVCWIYMKILRVQKFYCYLGLQLFKQVLGQTERPAG